MRIAVSSGRIASGFFHISDPPPIVGDTFMELINFLVHCSLFSFLGVSSFGRHLFIRDLRRICGIDGEQKLSIIDQAIYRLFP